MNAIDRPIRQWLDDLASRAPTPAVGSAAALSLSQGAALALKVVRFTNVRHRDANVRASLAETEDFFERLLAQASLKIEEDSLAVRALIDHFTASRKQPAQPSRNRWTESTLDDAMHVPLAILSLSADGIAALKSVIGNVNKTVLCEAGGSASLMWAAAEISHWIVCNNGAWLSGYRDWGEVLAAAREHVDAARRSHESVCLVVSRAVGDVD